MFSADEAAGDGQILKSGDYFGDFSAVDPTAKWEKAFVRASEEGAELFKIDYNVCNYYMKTQRAITQKQDIIFECIPLLSTVSKNRR